MGSTVVVRKRPKMYFLLIFIGIAFFGKVGLINGQPVNSDDAIEDSRIIGGSDAPQGFAPHMVALVSGYSNSRRIFCGGSIVSTLHILTAAHCIDMVVESNQLVPSLRAVIGTNKWNSTRHEVKLSSYINHPNWDEKLVKFDVGILTVDEELVLNDRIAVINLELDWVGGGEYSYVTGWGTIAPIFDNDIVQLAPIPQQLQLLHVSTIASTKCVEDMAEWASIHAHIPPINPQVEICTFHSINHGMCHGDSGSALVSKATGRQIGVVSWGFECASGAPDVFARISGVKYFLLNILKLNT